MATTTQTNVLQGITANVIQGMQRNSNFGGMNIARPLEQNSLSANWPVVNLADNFGIQDVLEARRFGAEFKQLEAAIKLDTSVIEGEGCEVPIDRSIARDAEKSGFSALSAFGMMLMKAGYIRHEKKVAAIAQGAGFDAVNSGTAYTNANKATADAPEDILAAIERVSGRGENPDTIVIPVEVWTRIRMQDRMRAFIAGTVNPGALVTAATLAKSFADEGIKQVIIGRARVNTANKAKAATIVPIWENSHIWVGSTDAAAETGDANSLGNSIATFFNAEHGQPYFLETYFCTQRRSDVLRVFGETNVKVINAQAGTRITTQYA